jgi:hypothetical protein
MYQPIVQDEQLLGLSDLAKLIPSRRRPGSLSTNAIFRWVRKGVRRPDGTIVKLEARMVAGRLLSSRAALERFIEAQNAPIDTASQPIQVRTPTRRRRESDGAAEVLARAGI